MTIAPTTIALVPGGAAADIESLERSIRAPSVPGRGGAGKPVDLDPAGVRGSGESVTPSGGNYRMERTGGGDTRLFFFSMESVLGGSVYNSGPEYPTVVAQFLDELLRDRHAYVAM
jgi:hypothetical protein